MQWGAGRAKEKTQKNEDAIADRFKANRYLAWHVISLRRGSALGREIKITRDRKGGARDAALNNSRAAILLVVAIRRR